MAPTVSAQAGVVRRLLDATVAGDRGAMADLVTADVTGWSPTLFVTSRDEPLAALEHRDDAFSGTSARRAHCPQWRTPRSRRRSPVGIAIHPPGVMPAPRSWRTVCTPGTQTVAATQEP